MTIKRWIRRLEEAEAEAGPCDFTICTKDTQGVLYDREGNAIKPAGHVMIVKHLLF